jgi:Transposase DDE domain
MFLRRCQRRRAGKIHTYWALVESYRTKKGSRQRVVTYLGELRPSERSGWAELGQRLDGHRRPRPSLFDPPAADQPESDEPVLVNLKGIRLEHLRDFGDVWLALGLWRLVELDVLLERLLPKGREDVAWSLVVAILVIARFCEPSSELHIEHTWYRRSALEELLGVPVAKVYSDRLYQGLDVLLPHKAALEKHLKDRLGDLFDLKYDLLLYDVTSTYFEGQCRGNPKAQRGYSRDSRPDCLQVCIGLVVTEDGIPLGYEVFPGNRHDSKTIPDIVAAMEGKYGQAQRIWVLDRGMVSEDNLEFLRRRGGQYIVGTPKAMLRKFESALVEGAWHTVQDGVEVKLVEGPEGTETFVLARSADRREKERAMHQRFLQRLEAGLHKLRLAADSGRLRDPALAHVRLGRLLQRYQRAAGAFVVTITVLPTTEAPPGRRRKKAPCLAIGWTRDDSWHAWAELSEGCYLLRTNLVGIDACTLWKRYIQLTDAEWAFRIHKDELVIRPIWHQKDQRVQAHILVCFLAYVLWKALAQWMQRSGLGDAPRTLIDELAKIKSGDVVLPTQTTDGQPARTVRLRCVTTPDAAQKVLLQRLGVTLPTRLRRLDEPARM